MFAPSAAATSTTNPSHKSLVPKSKPPLSFPSFMLDLWPCSTHLREALFVSIGRSYLVKSDCSSNYYCRRREVSHIPKLVERVTVEVAVFENSLPQRHTGILLGSLSETRSPWKAQWRWQAETIARGRFEVGFDDSRLKPSTTLGSASRLSHLSVNLPTLKTSCISRVGLYKSWLCNVQVTRSLPSYAFARISN